MRLRLIPILLFALASLLCLKLLDLAGQGLVPGASPAMAGDLHAASPDPVPATVTPAPAASARPTPDEVSAADAMAGTLSQTDQPAAPQAVAQGAPQAATQAAPQAGAAPAGGSFGRALFSVRGDVTGSIAPPADPASADAAAPDKDAPKPAAGAPAPPPVETVAPLLPSAAASPSERALLEQLRQRRTQLDQQARELDMRETLLHATERRVEDRIEALKALQQTIDHTQQATADANAGKLKALVTMYEGMKPKDAARIFNKLDLDVLVGVAGSMKPARVSDILAAMDDDAAQRLTLALAGRAAARHAAPDTPALDLPKIEGTAPPG